MMSTPELATNARVDRVRVGEFPICGVRVL